MKDLVHTAALAGLLHDVGKLARLGGESSPWPKYAHAELGDRFVQKFVPRAWHEKLAPVGWHHGSWDEERKEWKKLESTGFPVKIVALADRLSSGERETLDEESPRVKQLLTVFSRIGVGKKTQGPKAWFRPAKLSLRDHVVFPTQGLSQKVTEEFHRLWQDFCQEAENLLRIYSAPEARIESYLESMFFVLRDFTWCAPSAYWSTEPDVSLFSHLHATSALAAVLAHDFSDQEELVDRLLEAIKGDIWPEEPELALLGVGDIVGIQKFIYSLHDPKGAAAILRARSFFIQILNEVLARYILRELALPITCALYVGGGKFTLLLPLSAKETLPEVRKRLSKALWQGIGLQLVMAWTSLVPRDFQLPPEEGEKPTSPGIAHKLQEVLGRELTKQKMTTLADFNAPELIKIFAPQGLGGDVHESSSLTDVCDVCGAEVPREEIEPFAEDAHLCRRCLEFQKLGDQLRYARYLQLVTQGAKPSGNKPESPLELLRALGFELEVLQDPPTTLVPFSVVWDLIEPEERVGAANLYGPAQAAGRRFLTNFVPQVKDENELAQIREIFTGLGKLGEINGLDAGKVKHFGILAHQAKGAPYIAVLRMDMDNLGKIFSASYQKDPEEHEVHGLGRFATLSRITTLSFFVSLFFEGWVERIAKEMGNDSCDRLYAVYSGGDDLCFVGSWDAILTFTQRVREDFARFAARDDLGISGGIYVCHEKYPLFLAAQKAGEAEERAKRSRKKKDALSFLEMEVGWERFRNVKELAERLTTFIEAERAPRVLVRRIQEIFADYMREKGTRGPWGPWIWRTEYWLARFGEMVEDEEVKLWIEKKLRRELCGEKFAENIGLWALAARWAELATRR